MAEAMKAGTLFKPELVTEIMSKVTGASVLATLSKQTPIPFNGTEQFIFNLDGNAQIVGEGEQKLGNTATITSRVIKPMKFVYQARLTDEFLYCSEEKRLQFLKHYADGFAKKMAVAFDLAALHGLEPRSMTDGTFKATNSFDGVVTGNVITFNAEKIDDNIETAVESVVLNGYEVNGMALSPVAGSALGKRKDKDERPLYPEFRFGQNPDAFFGMKSDINKNLSTTGGTADTDHAIVGDFQNMFKWGYSENIPMKTIEYGDPDGSGRDLQAHNEICLRAEAFIGWGILEPKAFARVKA
ncbi:phage major capsid protein [Streptococcus suis]|uniref:phage major capsid protein n=1 Tax=Streptococcus suis TaxID=1307 RepID=UPI000CF5895E|nr:phage major capsid protein [Streptococcus suis]